MAKPKVPVKGKKNPFKKDPDGDAGMDKNMKKDTPKGKGKMPMKKPGCK
jgi:hypothetical protein